MQTTQWIHHCNHSFLPPPVPFLFTLPYPAFSSDSYIKSYLRMILWKIFSNRCYSFSFSFTNLIYHFGSIIINDYRIKSSLILSLTPFLINNKSVKLLARHIIIITMDSFVKCMKERKIFRES